MHTDQVSAAVAFLTFLNIFNATPTSSTEKNPVAARLHQVSRQYFASTATVGAKRMSVPASAASTASCSLIWAIAAASGPGARRRAQERPDEVIEPQPPRHAVGIDAGGDQALDGRAAAVGLERQLGLAAVPGARERVDQGRVDEMQGEDDHAPALGRDAREGVEHGHLGPHAAALREARRRRDVLELLHRSIDCRMSPKFPGSGRQQGAICTEVLEHLPDPRLCLHEIVRVLAPGGRAVLGAYCNEIEPLNPVSGA